MAYVIGRLRDEITVPFGVNVLWDPMASFAARRGHRGRLRARDLHRHLCHRHGDLGPRRRGRRPLCAAAWGVAMWPRFTTSRPSSPTASTAARCPTGRGRRCSPRSPMPCWCPARSPARPRGWRISRRVKRVLPNTPVLANTGRQACHRRRCAARGRWLHRRLGAEAWTATPGPRSTPTAPPISWPAPAPRGAGNDAALRRRPDRRADADPRPRRAMKTRVAAAIAAHLDTPGPAAPLRPPRQPDLHDPRRPRPCRSVMVFTHMDQLGFVVRKVEANGLIRLERLGGVPERALAAQAVVLCTDKGDLPGAHRQQEPPRHHARGEIQGPALRRALRRRRLHHQSRGRGRRRPHRHPRHLPAPRVLDPRQRPHRRHLGRRPRGLRGAAGTGRSARRASPGPRCTSSGRCRRNTTCAASCPPPPPCNPTSPCRSTCFWPATRPT